MMINVLQVGMSWNIGGTETYIMQQYRSADHKKIHYDFVNINSHNDIAFQDEILSKGSKIYAICSRHLNPVKHYYQWIKMMNSTKGKYSAIVLNSNSLEYVFPLFVAKLYGIPTRIIHSHNSGNQHKIGCLRKVLIFINKFLLNHSATNYCACSEKAGKWMFGANQKFQVIHNAIDTSKFVFNKNKRLKIRQSLALGDTLVLGHVASFCYQKNNEFMIEIFNKVHRLHPNSNLLLIGGAVGDKSVLNACKAKVKQLGLDDSVKFLGLRTDVPELMQAIDCFLLPSRFEGLPFVGIEAQASGLPCFFSDTITKELEITNLCHFIGLEKSSEEWAKIIVENSPIERRDMSNEIRKTGYDIQTEVRKIEKLYQKG